MSYLENGTTLRSQFSEMDPKRHHREMEESELLAHIAGKLGCDLERASRAFDSMRNTKSRVLVFDAVHGQWRGCDWKPADKAAFEQMLRDDQRALERKSIHEAKERRQLEANVEKLLARVQKLEKRESNLEETIENLEKLLARVESLEQMADQSDVSDKPSKNGFLEKKAQDRLGQKQKQPTREEQQAALMAKVMSPDWNNQPPVVPYVRPKTFSSGPKATDSGPKRVWREDSGDGREDSGDGYGETIKKHWQEG